MSLEFGLTSVLGTQPALLPAPEALPWVMRGLWATLLAGLSLGLLRRMSRHPNPLLWPQGQPRLAAQAAFLVPVLLLLISFMPGQVSPAWWLGLAFQAPSLMSVALCVVWALSPLPQASGLHLAGRRLRIVWPGRWATAGLLLGWLLLFDLLARLPVPLYAWGFGTPALAGVLVVAALLWALNPARAARKRESHLRPAACLALCITLFVLTRWPSGNLWDALIDPGLWLLLHLRLFSRADAPASPR